jgi:hypothetical protein
VQILLLKLTGLFTLSLLVGNPVLLIMAGLGGDSVRVLVMQDKCSFFL